MRAARVAALAAALLALGAPGARAQRHGDAPFSFVVLGHIRGSQTQRLNAKLAELLDRVRALHPDFVVLTGDIIFGDAESHPPRAAVVEDEWNAVDSALATLGVPVYRVPGNHDLHDVTTRDIYLRRYPHPPQLVTVRGSRLILLSSAFVPPDGDSTQMTHIGGVDIDSAQVTFLRQTLAERGYAHTFVFLHHTLWWHPDSTAWWREVHPLLAAAHVDNVFSGDYGPMKFSTTERDGVRYYQSSIEGQPSVPILQQRNASRLLSSQFDNFLQVRVAGDSAPVTVHTVAELSSGMFTPEQWKAIEDVPPPSLAERFAPMLDTTKKKVLLVCGALLMFATGVAAGRWRAGRG